MGDTIATALPTQDMQENKIKTIARSSEDASISGAHPLCPDFDLAYSVDFSTISAHLSLLFSGETLAAGDATAGNPWVVNDMGVGVIGQYISTTMSIQEERGHISLYAQYTLTDPSGKITNSGVTVINFPFI